MENNRIERRASIVVRGTIAILNALAKIRCIFKSKCCESECRMNQKNNDNNIEEEDEDTTKYEYNTEL